MEGGESTPSQPMMPCKSCGLPMPRGYALCSRCGSFQNWRRFINLSAPILGLLVALVSVIGVLAPAIVRLIWPGRAIIEVGATFLLKGGPVQLVFVNLGDREALLADELVCKDKSGNFAMFDSDGPSLVRPHEQVTSKYTLNATWLGKMLIDLNSGPRSSDDQLMDISKDLQFTCTIDASDGAGKSILSTFLPQS